MRDHAYARAVDVFGGFHRSRKRLYGVAQRGAASDNALAANAEGAYGAAKHASGDHQCLRSAESGLIISFFCIPAYAHYALG